jgi:hypothetical protein
MLCAGSDPALRNFGAPGMGWGGGGVLENAPNLAEQKKTREKKEFSALSSSSPAERTHTVQSCREAEFLVIKIGTKS